MGEAVGARSLGSPGARSGEEPSCWSVEPCGELTVFVKRSEFLGAKIKVGCWSVLGESVGVLSMSH